MQNGPPERDHRPPLSPEIYRRIVDTAPIPLLVYDEDGTVLSVSPGWTAATGLTLEDLPTVDAWRDHTLAERTDEFWEMLKAASDSPVGHETRTEVEILTEGGQKRTWILSFTGLGHLPSGKCSAVLRCMDVTERRAAEAELRVSEETFRSVLDAALDGVILMDRQGYVVQWLGACQNIFGWTKEEACGRPLADLIIPERLRDAHWAGLERYLASGEAIVLGQRLELPAVRRCGEEFPAEVAILAATFQGEQAFCGYIRDLTAAKAAESRIKELTEGLERLVEQRTAQLELANKELEGFTHSIAHDLRTSTRGIATNSRLMAMDEAERLSPEGRELLKRLENAALRLSELVDNLLLYARLGRKEPERSRVDLMALAKTAAEVAGSRHGKEVVLSGPAELWAWMDRHLAQLLMENLIDNAVKYTTSTTAVVEIGATSDASFFVKDSGIGFDMHYSTKVFEPFFRLHRDEDYAGTGIGLANFKRIVERHGGRVWVESKPGEGSTFYFRLM